jgi:hypothetical protein
MIDFLYANGCSWTAGNGIQDDPSLSDLEPVERWSHLVPNAWPSVVAEKLGVEHINEAQGAGSNARMVRTTCDFLRNYPKEKYSSLVVMLGWTTVDRNEVYLREDEKEGWCMFNATQPVSSHGVPFRPDFSKDYLRIIDEWQKDYILNVYSNHNNYVKFLQEMYLMSNLLENLGIRYLFFSSLPWRTAWMPNHDSFDISERFAQEIAAVQKPCILNTRDSDESLNVMSIFCNINQIPMATDCHTMIEGHRRWGEHLYQEFTNIYG